MSAHERDLFKAIVVSGAALVTIPGCGSTTPPAADAGSDAAVLVADAGNDAAMDDDANDPDMGMPAIL